MHICQRCGYKTLQKNNIRKHYKRKKICEPILKDISIKECLKNLNKKKKHVCEYCEREYSRSDSLKRHKEKCQEKRIRDLELKIKKLQPSLNTTTINNIDNSTNNITNNIFINSYNNTNYDVLVDHINECITNEGGLNMKKLIGCLHSNEDYPENHNIYIANANSKRIMKFENGKFDEDGRNDDGIYKFLKELADKIENHKKLSNSDLNHLSETLINQIDGKDLEELNKDDEKELERIKNDTISALLKSRKIIKETHKLK